MKNSDEKHQLSVSYWSNSLVPSDRANAINVMHASRVLSAEFEDYELVALVPANSLNKKAKIFEKYDVPAFSLRAVPYLKIKGWSVVYKLASTAIVLFGSKKVVISRSVSFANLALRLGKSVFLEMHQEEWKRGNSQYQALRKIISSPKLLGIGTNTLALKDRFLEEFTYDKDLVVHLPNGALIKAPSEESLTLAKETLKHLSGRFIVGYSGSLQKGKGADLVIDIANSVTDSDIVFVILGGRPDQIDVLKAMVKNNNVLFLGRYEHKHVAAFVSKFDLCLLPNEREMRTGKKSINTGHVTSPIKLFEYMAAGKPILASKAEVLGETLKESFSIQLPSENLSAWTKTIGQLRQDQGRCKSMGLAARQDLEQNYTWKIRGQKLAAFIASRYGK